MLVSSITLKDLLSFRDVSLNLSPLNVLIGPNASGKSNLLEAIGLLQAAPVDLSTAILRGGGIREWLWKGGKEMPPSATLECIIVDEKNAGRYSYRLKFSDDRQGFAILEERLQNCGADAVVHFDRRSGQVAFGGIPREGDNAGAISVGESVFARFKNPIDPTPVTRIGRLFEQIRVYKEFRTGPSAPARMGIAPATRKDFLDNGGDNLALVLNEMDFQGNVSRVHDYLGRFFENFKRVLVRLEGGVAQTYIEEKGLLEPVSAIRLSDGTLKFLCLLAVLLHPKPPPLICIEEPELGLHPDALQLTAEALIEASGRSQVVVTTHSESLVDALSSTPESVVICERDSDNTTQFRRLSRPELDVWLERYTLGQLWRKGEIGGNRW